MRKSEYVKLGRDRIMAVLADEYAVVHSELEARLADIPRYQGVERIQPHILTDSLRELGDAGLVTFSSSTTTNSTQPITTIEPSATHKIKTKVTRASSSKRKTYGRYLSWNHATQRFGPEGRIGPAGERVVRNSLLATHILTPLSDDAGPVSTVFGQKVNGPLDSGATYTPVIDGFPDQPITVLIEVKNIRSWIYPSAQELYQLLSKAVAAQRIAPDYAVLPILVCRRAHPKVFWMGKDLGFLVIDTQRQYVQRVPENDLLEVRQTLSFTDLVGTDETTTSEIVTDRLKSLLPKHAKFYARQWRETSESLHREILAVHATKNSAARNAAFSSLGSAAETAGMVTNSWTGEEDE